MIRGRLFRIVALASALAVLVTLFVAYIYSWTAPPVYRVPDSVELSAPLRPWAEGARILERTKEAYVLQLEGDRGALLYFGARGTTDPQAPEIRAIKSAWADFAPTVALCEGRLAFFVGGFDRGVRRFGESGAVYALGRDANVPRFTLEPDAAVEVRALEHDHEPRHVAAFLALRAFFTERARGRVGEDPRGAMERILAAQEAATDALPSVKDFEALWNREFAGVGDWRTVDASAIAPVGDRSALHAIARVAAQTRGEHMARAIAHLVGQGQRVFAVCDAAQVLAQEPALRAAIKP